MSGFATRLYRRPGEAERYPAAFLDTLAGHIRGLEPKGAALMVAVDGWGCGGKTALAEGLLDRLEPWMQCVSLDSFFAGFGQDQTAGPVPHLRWSELAATLESLARRGVAEVRDYDWDSARILPPEALQGRAWLVEGLHSQRRELRAWYDCAIWVEGGLEQRLDRVAARDGAHVIPLWEKDWMPRERAYIEGERPWRAADVIVAGAGLDLAGVGRQLKARRP